MPQCYANTTMVYRDEQSGELSGLSRVLCITQDDAHDFCRISQTKEEIQKIWEIVHIFYKAFNFPLKLRLSLRLSVGVKVSPENEPLISSSPTRMTIETP